MKKTIKLAVVAALALGATSAFATNGDIMIGQGAKSRSMGGVGIAKSFGAVSGLANPAMISSVKDSELTFVVTTFAPDVAFRSNAAANANPAAAGNAVPVNYQNSDANLNFIPEFAFASRINENFVYGISVSGTAGMGTDYDDAAFNTATDNGAFRMKTNLALLKVAIPLSYQSGDFTVGLTPILQYGSLRLSHMIQNQNGSFSKLDNGASTDIGYGVELGTSYKIDSLTVAAVYKSKISMKYDNTIGASINAFGGAAATGVASGDNLDQPAEIGIGLSYAMGKNTLAFDYKNIAYGDAAGYKDFGWENQNVYVLGYEYAGSGWAFRAGYNYAKSPIVEQNGAKGLGATGPTGYAGAVRNFFNLSGFPGIVESHYTIGGGYSISDALSIDAAFVYAAKVTNSFDTSGMTEAFAFNGALGQGASQQAAAAGATGTASSSADVTHSQMGLTLAVSYKF